MSLYEKHLWTFVTFTLSIIIYYFFPASEHPLIGQTACLHDNNKFLCASYLPIIPTDGIVTLNNRNGLKILVSQNSIQELPSFQLSCNQFLYTVKTDKPLKNNSQIQFEEIQQIQQFLKQLKLHELNIKAISSSEYLLQNYKYRSLIIFQSNESAKFQTILKKKSSSSSQFTLIASVIGCISCLVYLFLSCFQSKCSFFAFVNLLIFIEIFIQSMNLQYKAYINDLQLQAALFFCLSLKKIETSMLLILIAFIFQFIGQYYDLKLVVSLGHIYSIIIFTVKGYKQLKYSYIFEYLWVSMVVYMVSHYFIDTILIYNYELFFKILQVNFLTIPLIVMVFQNKLNTQNASKQVADHENKPFSLKGFEEEDEQNQT